MKKVLLLTLALSALAISCNKTDALDNYAYGNAVDIKASIVEKVETKSNYDLAGSTGTFYWTGTEKIGWMRWLSSSSYFWQTELTSKTSADSKEKTLVFSGTSYGDEVEYAFYPIWVSTPQSGIGWTSSPFKLFIPESTAYNSSAPLKDIVPMIAKLNGEGDFVFTPVTALIGVHVKNLPSDARSITLSSTGVALSGYYYLTDSPATKYADNLDYVMSNGLTVSMATNASNTTGEKTITFSSGLGKEEYAFYFPVSVGTLPNLTISVKGSDDSVLQTVTYDKSITTSRAVISDLPLMDLAKATTLAITGTSAAPYAYLEKIGPQAVSVRYAVASGEDAAKTAATSGFVFSGVGEENKVSLLQATSGKYYIAYQVLNSSSEVLYEGTKAFFCLSAADVNAAGTYKFDALYCLAAFDRSEWRDLTSSTDNRLVLEISDDPTKGSLMLTDYFGLKYDGTVTNKNLTNSDSNSVFQLKAVGDYLPNAYLNSSYFSAGSPVYGWLNSTNNYIYFDDTANQTFFCYNSVAYTLRNGYGNEPRFIFVYDKSGDPVSISYGSSTNLTLVPWNATVNGSGKFDGQDSMIFPSKDNSGNGAIVGKKQ